MENEDTPKRASILKRVRQLIKTGRRNHRKKDGKSLSAYLFRLAQAIPLTARGFARDMCVLRASALTFYSLLSIVPVAAMTFGIAKGFGFEKRLEVQLLQDFSAQQEILTKVFDFARSMLENTKGGLIAGVGLVALFWAVIMVLSHIEHSFNAIWRSDRHRSLGRKFSDYLSIMLISPILVLMSGSATVFITTHVTHAAESISIIGMFSPLIRFALRLLPYALIWLLFTLLYIIMPNTRVKLASGLLAGLLAGSLYQIAQLAYINFQVMIARYNAIYGSFAALPLFLIWMQISWLIVLLGAEFAAAWQNFGDRQMDFGGQEPSVRLKQLLALKIVQAVIRAFERAQKAPGDAEIAGQLGIPRPLVRRLLDELAESGLLSRICGADGGGADTYQPAFDIRRYSVQQVIETLEKKGVNDLPVAVADDLQPLADILKTFDEAVNALPANRLLKDI